MPAPPDSKANRARRATGLWTAGVLGLVPLFLMASAGAASPAEAAEGSIDYVEPGRAAFQVLYSLPGAAVDSAPDLDTIDVSLNGQELTARGELAADAGITVRRTTVLAVDVSSSMRKDNRFEEAKRAAKVFLDNAPDDLYIAIVTFAGDVVVAQTPSLDRQSSAQVVAELTLSNQTKLYDGILEAVATAGTEGSRSVLVLSDGRDTSNTQIEDVSSAIEQAKVRVDVVALAQNADDTALLQQLSDAGNGSVINADDPAALTGVFAEEAEALARQILITVDTPEDRTITEGTLEVSVETDSQKFTDTAFVTVASPRKVGTAKPTKLNPVPPQALAVSRDLMLGGLTATGVAVLVLLAAALGGLRGGSDTSLESRISAYTRKGSRSMARSTEPSPQGMTAQAVGVAERALEANQGLASAVGQKLEAAGMSLKPAEWVLAHAAIAFGVSLMALLLASGNILFALGGLVFGLLLPWAYLSFKTSRRVKRFKAQLADTLQLMAGSLSAGLSLAQSVDTVVREGSDPISNEFRRAIVEARLGVEIEDALESISDRMDSRDFAWVVMAIRIQREVGGNLSELLNNVAATIREREYLERQVSALSAEGRLSVWILGGLPPAFMGYLLIANPTYLKPLISTPIGFVLLGVMSVLLVVGILWMKKLVKVEV